jgi:hypothetical protein
MSAEQTVIDLNSEMKDIGIPVGLDSNADRGGTITNKMKKYMNLIDLIPVDWSLTYPQVDPDKPRKGCVKLTYDSAITNYQNKCVQYGLFPTKGLRIWNILSAPSAEQFTNSVEDNEISKKANSLSANTNNLRHMLKSVGYNPNDALELVKTEAQRFTNTLAPGVQNFVKKAGQSPIVGLLSNIIAEGKQFSLPKIWTSADYSSSLQITIRLASPYGDPLSILENVLKPLLYILILASPESDDGLSYGHGTYVQVFAYGCSNMDLAMITTVAVNRGGSDITFNKYGQPLSVEVQLTLTPMLTGFSSVYSPKTNIQTMRAEDILQPISNNITGDNIYGMITIDNVIRSFQKAPGTDNPLDILTGSLTSPITTITGAIRGAANDITGRIRGGIQEGINTVARGATQATGAAASRLGIIG